MAGHGGSRAGAGKPRQEITRLAARLIDAFPAGYEIVGKKKGMTGEADAIQREVVANILADEILAGRGINVVRLEVDLIGKLNGKDDKSKGGSLLIDSLSKCPGLLPDTGASSDNNTNNKSIIESMATTIGTTHSKCDGSKIERISGMFNSQLAMPLDLGDDDEV